MAKTMLDRRAIAEMVENYERAKRERESAHSVIEFEKKLEDKISSDISDNFPGEQSDCALLTTDERLFFAVLVFVILALIAFLVFPV